MLCMVLNILTQHPLLLCRVRGSSPLHHTVFKKKAKLNAHALEKIAPSALHARNQVKSATAHAGPARFGGASAAERSKTPTQGGDERAIKRQRTATGTNQPQRSVVHTA